MALLWNASTLSLRYAPGRPPRPPPPRSLHHRRGARVTTYAGTGRPPRPPARRGGGGPPSLLPPIPSFSSFLCRLPHVSITAARSVQPCGHTACDMRMFYTVITIYVSKMRLGSYTCLISHHLKVKTETISQPHTSSFNLHCSKSLLIYSCTGPEEMVCKM